MKNFLKIYWCPIVVIFGFTFLIISIMVSEIKQDQINKIKESQKVDIQQQILNELKQENEQLKIVIKELEQIRKDGE